MALKATSGLLKSPLLTKQQMFNRSQDAVYRRYKPVVINTPMLCKCINRFRGRDPVPGIKPTDFSVPRVSKSINRMRTPHVVNEFQIHL